LKIDGSDIPELVQCFNSDETNNAFQEKLSSAFKKDRKAYNNLIKVIKNQTF